MFKGLFISLVIFLIHSESKSQDYWKNSYLIYGFNKDGKTFTYGSFFLVQIGATTYFVTAGHVVTGWNGFKNCVELNEPDTMTLRFVTYASETKFLRISTKQIKQKAQHKSSYLFPDLYIAKMTLPKDVIVKSMDSFMNVNYVTSNPVSAFTFGYLDTTEMLNRLPVESFGKPAMDVHTPTPITNLGIIDTVNNFFSIDKTYSRGFSGSPLFVQDAAGPPYFGGICIGGGPEPDRGVDMLIAVKPSIVRDAIRKRAKSIPYLRVFP